MLAKLTLVRVIILLSVLVFILPVIAQKKISGKVTSDTDKQPLFVAAVSVKGTNVAAQTDAQGAFSLSVPAGKKMLLPD